MKELDYALENTDLNKTPGPDGIHGQMISNLGKNGKEKLLDIFNNSWKTGKLPQDWKTATIIPIKKLDKSVDDPKPTDLSPSQVKDAQNRKPTNHTIAAFLDLTQAFDKVWKNKLITKLYKHFKIDGKAITWINDFLKNRYIRVKYNGTLSKTFKLYQGLPQGSVLSPTLFTLFIAGIEEKIAHKTNIGLFAVDIILWSSNTNWKKAERDLNKTLSHLEKFANKHKLEFNPQKSETCLFTTDKKLYKIRPKIILKEQQLQYNKHPKYLGYTLDPEINSSKHIEEVIRKGRDRLKILKYISGREWGADATTLKLTYTSLIRPILEYGYQIYDTASETNLKSLERIQLSAARIITGLRNTCPNDIVLYEADIMPLKDRRSYNLPKYINKIKSYGNKHRTSKYILNWESNLRLKKEGPLHLAKRNEFLKYKVEKNYLAEKISPCKPQQNVIFNATLNEPTNRQYQNPEYLKQLSLEIINNIPKNAITIYTDGSRDELGHTGSGCLIKTTNGIEKMNRRNPDFCSVFRSELIAIYEALKSIRNTNYQDIWILTDSRSAIQHLSHTGELRDKVSRNIIGYLQKLSKTSKIHLQWIPSHVGIEGNEAADVLAKKGTKEPLPQKNKLTFKEIETVAKTKINKNWRIPPKHSWYSGVNPGGALNIRNRQHQTTLTRFRTGHLKPLKIENNNKIYPTCPKCSLAPAAPEHILACIRCTKQDLWERPLLIIKQLEEHELMEFVDRIDFLGFVGHRFLTLSAGPMLRFDSIIKISSLPSADAQQVAKFVLEDVVLKHGAPREIITDRGRVFQSKLISELTGLCSSAQRFTTAYHPQTNGLTERLNKTLADMMSMYVDVEQKEWDVILPFITFAYNTAKQDTTGFTPFSLIHGREAETRTINREIVTRAEETRQLARLHTLRAQEGNKRLYDAKHREVSYQPGDKVWIFIPVRKIGISEKLIKRYFGPYRVTRRISDVTYEVESLDTTNRRRKPKEIVHVVRMKNYRDPDEQLDLPEDEPALILLIESPRYDNQWVPIPQGWLATDWDNPEFLAWFPFGIILLALRLLIALALWPFAMFCGLGRWVAALMGLRVTVVGKPDPSARILVANHITLQDAFPIQLIKCLRLPWPIVGLAEVRAPSTAQDLEYLLSAALQIVRLAVTNGSVTSRTVAQHIQSLTHHPVPARTIRCRLQQIGLSTRRPLLCLPLAQNHRRLRRHWCEERMWTAEWNGIVFTDESCFCLQQHYGRIRVWRHRGERMLNSCVMHCHTGPVPGLAHSQQDNERPHVARIVQRFFVNRQIELLPWPARSPDLSPIENMWSIGCSMIDRDYIPSCHTRSTLATCGGQQCIKQMVMYPASCSVPILVFPEETTTNGRVGLLHFTKWPFLSSHKIQPGYGGAASVLMLESAAKASASMLEMASNYWQSQTFTKVCLDHGAMINESCTPTPHSMRSVVDLHAASPIAQNKQGREALPKKLYWNYRKADWTKFRQESNLTPKITNDKQHLNSKWKKWKTTVLKAAKKTIPSGNRKQYIPGYIETINSLQNEITQRNQAQEYLMENNELENKINLSKLSAQVRQKANQLKQRKWRDICSNLGPHTRDTKLWKLIKSINQETPYSTTSNTFTDKDGNILTEQTQISNLFADYYTQISKLKFSRQDKKILQISKKIRNEAKTTSHQDLFHKPFLPHELKEAINRLDDNKTPGSDIISAKMIKHLETNSILELLHIINLSWSSSTLPKEWKHAIIIPIHKAGKTENHPQSYRPISLTSIPCKLMERMILNRMQYFLNKNKLLTKQQAAFKKYHNTVDQIFYFTQKIQDNFQSKPTKSTIAAFIDLSQAFDRVWKERLIKKLDKLGIRGKMMGWIGSFLTGRTFQVNFKEQLSKTGRLFQGLPQGSILSPLLFSIYLNDMDSRITKYCDFALYADYIIIWSSKRDFKEANKNVNKALKELQHFAEKMKLIINPNKSEVGTVLRAKKRLDILKRISGYEWGADRDTLRQTYLALIRPILEYAQPVWQTASKTNLNKIDQVQSSAARIICGLRNICPTKIAEIEANLLPLTHRRKIGLADYIYKRVNAPKSHRTGEFIRKWKPKTRLKRLSPMYLAYRELLPNSTRNRNAQNQYAPYKERPEISYNLDLEQECSKRADHPGLLRSLAMERIEKADKETIQIYTDGSLVENGSSGSGVLILKDSMEIKRRIKNPKNLSVFRSKLTAILQALKLVEKNETKNIIIYTDSKAAIFAICWVEGWTDGTHTSFKDFLSF
ncbi:hypothetical protein LAZ67_1006915 [Cordylochernes scorpioides]|uniref:Uncharacterized protein n=1 Tax=Cordylochernes scorpioides TaxID=51811 RepID=A0ABY6JYW2_9ARAC|nr:hypothetical protein LAZ67_1006915 [Cordylochernes scorpioides]